MPNFTDLTIRALSPGLHFDSRTPGFAIRVGKHRKTWLVVKGETRTKIGIGHYPQLSLQDARKKALVVIGSPFETVAVPTFPQALDTFLSQDRWRASSKRVLETSLRCHFKWTRPLNKITHEEVATAIDAIATKGAASHALKDIRTFFNWCVPRYLARSPADGLKMPRYIPRERVLADEELKRVWNAAITLGYPFGDIVRLLILTGQRRSEIASLRWADVREQTITLPETKNGRTHTFPMGDWAATILDTAPRTSVFVFPARGTANAYNGFAAGKSRFDKLCKVTAWTLHDLRRTFATNLAALGTPIHVTEKLLNHVSGTTGGIVAVYQKHSYWDGQVSAIRAWEERLAAILAQR